MKQEDKELLLKDLCGRLPYGVKIALKNNEVYHHENIAKVGDTTIDELKGFDGKYFRISHDNPLDWEWYVSEISIEDIKPYLFPLSSITKEQEKEYGRVIELEIEAINDEINHTQVTAFEVDFYHKYHLDWRELIPKGLAVDCTNLNIY